MNLDEIEISRGFLEEENRNHYLYRHIRLDKNEPFYIGQGKYSFQFPGERSLYFRARVTHKNNKIWKDITKKTKYKVEILFDNLTKEEVNIKEIELIKLYGRIFNDTGILANFAEGGEGNSGVIPTLETRKKMSEVQKNRIFTSEHRERISVANKGKKFSEERKQKMSEITKKLWKEKTHPMLGKHHSEECRKKMSQNRKGIKRGLSNFGEPVIDSLTGKVYSTCVKAALFLGVSPEFLRNRLSGKLYNNTSFVYLKDYPEHLC